jgi:membrane peptidoglycan carboxypeptidase
MTARESAWDGGPPDPPTAPLPRLDYRGNVGPDLFAPSDWQATNDWPASNDWQATADWQVRPAPQSPADWQARVPYQAARPRRRRRRLLRRVTVLVVVVVTLAVLAFGVLLLITPSVGNASALAQAQAVQHHSVYPGPPVAARFAASLVATEDHRFYSEPGIDPLAIARVAEAAVTGQGDQGGATINQQLAKMLYTSGTSSTSGALAKVEQVGLAVKLYMTYSHAQILQMYADVAYFGHGYYGLSAASCGYFGTSPAGLSWPEAAMLAGLVQGPSADDPILHFAQARAREQHVLGRLAATNTLSQAQADAAFAQPLHLVGGSGTACGATS